MAKYQVRVSYEYRDLDRGSGSEQIVPLREFDGLVAAHSFAEGVFAGLVSTAQFVSDRVFAHNENMVVNFTTPTGFCTHRVFVRTLRDEK